MAGMKVISEKCVGCGLCIKSCPQSVIKLVDGKAVIGEDCIACGICRDTCRLGAIERESKKASLSLGEYHGIMVAAETQQGKIADVTLELMCKAKELANNLKCSIFSVLIGQNMKDAAKQLIAYGAEKVLLYEQPDAAEGDDELHALVVTQAIEAYRPEIVLYGATEFGRSIAPRVAAALHTGLTADCTVLEIDPETKLLQQTRPAFGGNLMATIICPGTRPQMATVRPGVMKKGLPDGQARGQVIPLKPAAFSRKTKILQRLTAEKSAGIGDAQIIVAVGKGIGSRKNIKLAQRAAELLGGAVAATRPLIDAGWAEYPIQVGQTGKTVAPKLYLACGISGAIQHLAGMSGSERIIAVNTDPDAPIFKTAHYGICGDCVGFLKELIAQLEREQPQTK